MSETAFLQLRDHIYEASGLYFDEGSRLSLERRLRPRLTALHLQDFEQYFLYLQFDRDRQQELQIALDSVAVHETYFFREQRALRAFREEILPEIAERNRNHNVLRVWSAGCSTGEEAYTIAILIFESGLFDGWTLEISASDLSQRVITEARIGQYKDSSFRSTEDRFRTTYFKSVGEKIWLIDERLRSAVSFGCFNLADVRRYHIFNDLDVIFCRNVMIYFDSASRRRTVDAFHEQLRQGGYLILGAAESLVSLNAPFRLAHLNNDLVYQKP